MESLMLLLKVAATLAVGAIVAAITIRFFIAKFLYVLGLFGR